jgi:PHD/YefM family antitoxin component YafN of YafNO toxin-antitoxin module
VSVGDFLREACSVLDYVKRTGNVVRLKKRDDPTVVIVPLQVWRDAQTLHEKEVRDALQLQRFLKSQLKDFEFEDLKSDAGIK